MNPFSLRTAVIFALLLIVGDAYLMLRKSNRSAAAQRTCIGLQSFSVACDEPIQRF